MRFFMRCCQLADLALDVGIAFGGEFTPFIAKAERVVPLVPLPVLEK